MYNGLYGEQTYSQPRMSTRIVEQPWNKSDYGSCNTWEPRNRLANNQSSVFKVFLGLYFRIKGSLQKYIHDDKIILSIYCGKGEKEVKKNKMELRMRRLF